MSKEKFAQVVYSITFLILCSFCLFMMTMAQLAGY